MLFGIVLVVVVTLLPEGLTGLPARLRRRAAR
jgi:ABC-type branched-subunit amino acid transport system permease subunit